MKQFSKCAGLILFLLFSITAEANSLSAFCTLNEGELLTEWTCPASGKTRKGQFCKVINEQNQELVFNGCTGAKGKYGDLFFKACTLHDFCYHHEPQTTGKSKEDCDKKFLADALQTCSELASNSKRCRTVAYSFYTAVKVGGSGSWNCSKEAANYPTVLESL